MQREQTAATLRSMRLLAGATLLLFGLAGCVEYLDKPPLAAAECPAWGNYRPVFYENEPSAYLGCDENVNLLNMVERTGDTISGRPLGPADGEVQTLAVKNYETGKVAPLAATSTTGGTQ